MQPVSLTAAHFSIPGPPCPLVTGAVQSVYVVLSLRPLLPPTSSSSTSPLWLPEGILAFGDSEPRSACCEPVGDGAAEVPAPNVPQDFWGKSWFPQSFSASPQSAIHFSLAWSQKEHGGNTKPYKTPHCFSQTAFPLSAALSASPPLP